MERSWFFIEVTTQLPYAFRNGNASTAAQSRTVPQPRIVTTRSFISHLKEAEKQITRGSILDASLIAGVQTLEHSKKR
jgi:hypothetical protein